MLLLLKLLIVGSVASRVWTTSHHEVVDYGAIDKMIAKKITETTDKFNAKFSQCEEAIQQAQEKITVLEKKLTTLAPCDCWDVTPVNADAEGGIFVIYPDGRKTEVYCDQTTDGGGWIVFQRRKDGSIDFYRGWNEYVDGFGSKDGEFWLGLDTIHHITTSGKYELRVDMEDWSGNKRFAKYSTFKIGDGPSNYQLTVGEYSGDAGDSLSVGNGLGFTTKDSDHDTYPSNCAVLYKGAWWYTSCHHSNLNGLYHKGGTHTSYADGVNWMHWKGFYYSLKFVEMKIRPAQ